MSGRTSQRRLADLKTSFQLPGPRYDCSAPPATATSWSGVNSMRLWLFDAVFFFMGVPSWSALVNIQTTRSIGCCESEESHSA